MNKTNSLGRRIALIGKMGAGNSFVAAQLANALGAERISFEREVHKVAEQVLGRKIDRTRYLDRQMFADIRIHWGRNGEAVDAMAPTCSLLSRCTPNVEARLSEIWQYTHEKPDTWGDALDRAIAEVPPDKPLILDDLQFVNEMEFLLDRGFCIFRVDCSPETHHRRLRRGEDAYEIEADFTPYPCGVFARGVSTFNVGPTLWNDHRPAGPDIREDETTGMFMTPADLVTALRNNVRDGMLSPTENAAKWRIYAHLFENPYETKAEYDAWIRQENLDLH